MKIIISLFIAFLMTDGGSCRPAQFIDNSRIVVEGKVIDTLGKPIPNQTFYFDNHINYLESKTKVDGSFIISAPITDQGSKIRFFEKSLVKYQSNNPKVHDSFGDIMFPSDITYVKLENVTLK